MFLNELILSESIKYWGSSFHELITRLEKKFLYVFVLNSFLYNLRLCPLVLDLLNSVSGLILVKPFKILGHPVNDEHIIRGVVVSATYLHMVI